MKRESIAWPNGVWFANPKTKEALVFMTLRPKTGPSLASGFSNFCLNREFGRHSLGGNLWAHRRYPKWTGNRVTPHFWAGLMATKKFFFPLRSFSIKDGSEIRFWEDKWMGNTTLREQFPALYNIARHKSDMLASMMATSPSNVSFRRSLFGPRQACWLVLLQCI